jgi:hypothetical protein
MNGSGSRPSEHGVQATLALVILGPLAELDRLEREVATRQGVRLVYVKTSPGRLRIVAEPPLDEPGISEAEIRRLTRDRLRELADDSGGRP